MMSRFGRWALGMVVAGGLAAGATYVVANKGQTEAAPAAGPAAQRPVPVRVETVVMRSAEESARYAAVIRPRIEADLGFRVGGKVAERLVEVGARVVEGTPLAKLDPADLELQVRAVEAQLASARANALNARNDFERYASLRRGQWTTQQELDKRRATTETADAKVRELEAQLRVSRNSARYAVLHADGPGVVTAVLAEPGQVVAQGQAVFRVARLGEVEAVADIPENRVGLLDKATMHVELWSRADVKLAGRLRELSPSADAATRTYRARVTLVAPPPDVQLGMTATLVVERAAGQMVAAVPGSAITKTTDGSQTPAVWVLNADGDAVALRPVAIVAYAGDRAIVANGLAGGERIVTAGVHKLDAKQPVRIWSEPIR